MNRRSNRNQGSVHHHAKFLFYLFYFPKKMQSFALILALLSRAWRTRAREGLEKVGGTKVRSGLVNQGCWSVGLAIPFGSPWSACASMWRSCSSNDTTTILLTQGCPRRLGIASPEGA